jgi:ADP-ribose pyrophosphatase
MTEAGGREVVAQGRHLRLVRDNGWEYVERIAGSGVVVIAAVTAEGRLLLVEQFRRPVGRRVIELPAGLAGDVAGCEREPLGVAARRELIEETGYAAESMSPLAVGPPSAGLSAEIVTFLHADGLRRVGPGGGDAGEAITVHEVPVGAAPAWLEARARDGILIDPKVYAGLYFLERPLRPAE